MSDTEKILVWLAGLVVIIIITWIAGLIKGRKKDGK